MARSAHLNLDGAWEMAGLDLEGIDALSWGPKLRFSAPSREIEKFYDLFRKRTSPFLLFGSGDFHHLSALWIRRVTEPLTVVSFDNHPDWDLRPPRWGCGGWVNRALDQPQVEKVVVWGCGNFECWWPGQIFGNRRAEQSGRLVVHPWAGERPLAQQNRRGAIFRSNWQEAFTSFANDVHGARLYVTIDLDCLGQSEAITNWENGKFTAGEVAWALRELRSHALIVAGDVCGAFSVPKYARWKQRFAAGIDHPRQRSWDVAHARRVNRIAFDQIWPALTD